MSRTKVADDQLLPGLVFKWRGEWLLSQPYPKNHLVKCDGSVYISKVNQTESNSTTRPLTGENWQLCWDIFVQYVGGSSADLVVRECPAGLVDSNNTVFVLHNNASAGMEQVFLNGVLQEPDGHDYIIDGRQITFVSPPLTDDRLRVTYVKARS